MKCQEFNSTYFKPKNPTWRNASYRMIAAELDKFNERAASLSSIGILIRVSGYKSCIRCGSPAVSLPNTIKSPS